MKQYEPYIQNNNDNNKRLKKKKKEKWQRREGVRVERERFFLFFLSSLLSKIYGNWTVGFRRSRRQS